MNYSLFARRTLAARTPTLALLDLDEKLDRVDSVPTLSGTVVRAMSLANDPNATLSDFATLIRRDATVAALLLKRANSAAVGASVADVSKAVMLLGLKKCAQLAATVGLRKALGDFPLDIRERCESILRHSLFVAHLSAQLNRTFKMGFAGEEFTGGLLHDIGRVILSTKSPATARTVDPVDFNEEGDTLNRERIGMGTDHCGVGGVFASKNNLPAPVMQVITRHHHPEDVREHRNLVALVAIADDVANHVQRTRILRDFPAQSRRAYIVLSEKWPPTQHQRFEESLGTMVKAAVRETRQTLKAVSEDVTSVIKRR